MNVKQFIEQLELLRQSHGDELDVRLETDESLACVRVDHDDDGKPYVELS